MPAKEYPAFEAALSFLPAIAPDEAASLLREREARLEAGLASAGALRELVEKVRLPRLFWVEAELATALRQAELDFVRRLRADLDAGSLDGVTWWRRMHENPDAPIPMPPPWGAEPDKERP